MEHKHAEVLRAIADGKKVEWFGGGNYWIEAESIINPLSYPHYKWRIKPEKQYRVALMNDGDFYSATVDNEKDAKDLKKSEYFVEWVSGWQEVGKKWRWSDERTD
jgi:hypothetical protein